MKIENKHFKDDNFDALLAFIRKACPTSQKVWGWDTGRFIDWYWGSNNHFNKKNRDFFSKNCELFYFNNSIVAAAISEDGGKEASIISPARDSKLTEHVLNWLLLNWSPMNEGLDFEFSGNEEWLATLLRKKGFKEDVNSGNEWEYDLNTVPDSAPLSEGFRICSLKDNNKENDYNGISEVIIEAFNSKDSPEVLTSILKGIEENPLFDPELSLFVKDKNRRIAAYCRGTVDPDNGICGVDPVCCHSDYRRLGLSKAMVRELFKRQKSKGGKLSYIGSAPIPAESTFLYRSLEPVSKTNANFWKNY